MLMLGVKLKLSPSGTPAGKSTDFGHFSDWSVPSESPVFGTGHSGLTKAATTVTAAAEKRGRRDFSPCHTLLFSHSHSHFLLLFSTSSHLRTASLLNTSCITIYNKLQLFSTTNH